MRERFFYIVETPDDLKGEDWKKTYVNARLFLLEVPLI